MKQETVSGSGVSWAICKSAPRSRQDASTPPLSFLQAGCPSCHPTNSVKALKAQKTPQHAHYTAQWSTLQLGLLTNIILCPVLRAPAWLRNLTTALPDTERAPPTCCTDDYWSAFICLSTPLHVERSSSQCTGSVKTAGPQTHTIRYDTRCYFNVRSKAGISRLNLPHGTDN